MKKVVIYGILGLVSILALIFLIAAFQPQDWRMEKSVVIAAPREQVWAVVSDLNRYNEWNPYYLMEPEAKITVQGPAATVGSSYAWDGEKSGSGVMTTTAVAPLERMDFRLDFQRPMQVTNIGSFVLSEIDQATTMTWTMSGRHEGFGGLVARAIHLFVGLETLLGKSFETGLGHLKTICEKKP